ncbi:MAG: glutathione S-transferase family protein, partial [Caulobacteraceae bacterium]
MTVTVYGADYSCYVRIVRLALEEKGVPYRLVPVDIFAEEERTPDYLVRHPFAKIPSFDHDGFMLYEASAISRYVDAAFDGAALLPVDPPTIARVEQIISVCDSYIYQPLVWDVYVERLEKAGRGEKSDEDRITDGLDKAKISLGAITRLMSGKTWLAGEDVTLADLHLAPMMDFFLKTLEGRRMIANFPLLVAWWERMRQRPSML